MPAFVGSAGAVAFNGTFATQRALLCGSLARRPRVASRKCTYALRASLEDDEYVTTSIYTETTLIPETVALDPGSGSTIVPASFALPGAFLATAAGARFLLELPALWVPLAIIGLFLSVQAANVRFVFGPERLSVTRKAKGELKIIRGWKYDEFKNWEVWWPRVPVLCYFRENESYGGKGSIHFFPVVCDGGILVDELKKRIKGVDKKQ